MNVTRRHLRLQSDMGSFPTHLEIEATRREHAGLLGIDPAGVLASSWGLCPIPIPPLGGAKPGDNLPTRINPRWAWHPVFWLPAEYRTREADEDDDRWLLRLLLALSDTGLVIEEPGAPAVVFLDPFELGQMDGVDQSRLRLYRDGTADEELRGFVVRPPHPDEVERLLSDIEAEARESFEEMLAEKIDAEEAAVDEANAFFDSFDPYPLVRGSDPVIVAANVDKAMVEGERHLAALLSWWLSSSGRLSDGPDAAAATLDAAAKRAQRRSEERSRLIDALYASRGSSDVEREMRGGLRAQLLSLCEEASRLRRPPSPDEDATGRAPADWAELQSHRSHPHAVCVHRHFRRWMSRPFPGPTCPDDEENEHLFEKH